MPDFGEIKKSFRKNRLAYLYIMPSFIVLLMVIAYPFVYNIVISMSNMGLMHFKDWEFVGLSQYGTILRDVIDLPDFASMKEFFTKLMVEPNLLGIFIKNCFWTFTNLFFHVTIGVALALALNQRLPGRAIFRTLLILPWAVPQYISALTWRGMFQYEYGAVNLVLQKYLHLAPIEWQSTPLGSFAGALITNIWLGFPFMMIVALGGLQSIPRELYEAADIDGASWFHKLRHITLPLLKPVMVPAISLGVIWTFNNFNVIWLVTNGGRPADSAHIMVSYVYRAVFNFYRYGYGAALSMIIFIILLLFSIKFIRGTKATETVY